MKNLLLLLLLFVLPTLVAAQITFENAFPNISFNLPVDIQNNGVSGDNRLFVVEQPGRIRVVENQASATFSRLFLDITNVVNFTPGQEKGLLGLAFHPNYNQNGYFYVSYTNNVNGVIGIVIERYTVNPNNPNQADPNSACTVLSFLKNQSNSNHNGGSIAFGPDGLLYISVGDGGGGGDPQGNAQNLNSLFGKILRININTSCPGYTIPSGNPLISSAGANEIYAWGMRNSWRISFDFQTNTLWAGDVGQGQFEEINIIQNGRNYGWNRFEAFSTFNASAPNISNPAFPIFSYNHNQGDVSITGGYVYRGSQINNALNGEYVFGDFASGRVWSLNYNPQNGATDRTLLFDTNFQISTFGQDINDELYFTNYGSGRIYKLISNSTPPPPPPSSCMVTVNNCSITLNGLANDDFIKIFDADFNELWRCSPFGDDTPCNEMEVVSNLGDDGTYFVQACGDTEGFVLTGCNNQNSCASQGGDSDGDGICNNQDCQPNNSNFPATPGTSCNDGNPNTSNDRVSADGCGCFGTPATAGCSVSVGGCSITFNGLAGDDFIKIFDEDFNEIWTCTPFGNNNEVCNSTEVVTGLENGVYYVQGCQGDFDRYELTGCNNQNSCASQGGDSDGDGICNNQDCQPNNPSFPNTPGTACNDGNPNTVNDVVSSDGCGCFGTPVGGGCLVTEGACSLMLTGLAGDDFIKIFDASFNEIWSCSPFRDNTPCNPTEVINNLGSGFYYVQGCDGDFDMYTVFCSQGVTRVSEENNTAGSVNAKQSIFIFPNPAQDEINIDLTSFIGKQALMQIYDARGILIKERQVAEVMDHPEKINLQGMLNGLYIITVKFAERRLISKPFVVNKLY